MKAVFSLVVVVVVILGVAEVNASCATSCSSRCYNKGCKYYAAAIRSGTCYCCCFKGGSDSFFNIGHVNEMTPREDFNEDTLMEIQNHKN
uniref:Mytilin 1 n=1 Tax=Perna viridis TaxID=73031 RepID=A0A6B9XNI2_PERVI|nr:mytilin 1 [Perna viridis]